MTKIQGKIINYDNSFIGEIVFENEIKAINKLTNSNTDNYIIPGFIDLHCHGGNGFDTMGGLSSIENLSSYHLKNGTTTLLPTTITASLDDTMNAVKGLNNLKFILFWNFIKYQIFNFLSNLQNSMNLPAIQVIMSQNKIQKFSQYECLR